MIPKHYFWMSVFVLIAFQLSNIIADEQPEKDDNFVNVEGAELAAHFWEQRQRDWERLCSTYDCDELPEGYHTIELEDRRFYFPLRRYTYQGDRSDAESSVELVRFAFGDYDQDQRLLRSFSSASSADRWVPIHDCCDELFAWFDIDVASLPGNQSEVLYLSPPTPIHSSTSYDSRSVYFLLNARLPEQGEEIAPTDIPNNQVMPISDTLSIWTAGPDDGSIIELFSSKQLVADRFVHISCSGYCRFSSLRKAADADGATPLMDFRHAYRGSGSWTQSCQTSWMREGSLCPEMSSLFEQYVNYLEAIDQMIVLSKLPKPILVE